MMAEVVDERCVEWMLDQLMAEVVDEKCVEWMLDQLMMAEVIACLLTAVIIYGTSLQAQEDGGSLSKNDQYTNS